MRPKESVNKNLSILAHFFAPTFGFNLTMNYRSDDFAGQRVIFVIRSSRFAVCCGTRPPVENIEMLVLFTCQYFLWIRLGIVESMQF